MEPHIVFLPASYLTYQATIAQAKPNGRQRARFGFTLLELVLVVAVLGMLAAISVARLSPGIASRLSSGSTAFQILGVLRQARSMAISSGDDHVVTFISADGAIRSVQIDRDEMGTLTTVDGPFDFDSGTTVTLAGGNPRFNFLGEAAVAPVISCTTSDHTERITIVSSTGWGVWEEL